jgi:adenylosuccinate lyase
VTELDEYRLPLTARYASPEMSTLWGDRNRFTLWRTMWITLAEAERELGLPITEEQIAALKAGRDQLDLKAAAEYERRFRHDVMAHVHAFGDVAPSARPIIHLGATSAFVTDNVDLIQMRDGLRLLSNRLAGVVRGLADFARKHRALATLGFTHFQPAQLTTVGKRACLWIQDLLLDLVEVDRLIETLPLRGVKGTTGTQASFLELFDGDHEKVRELDRRVAAKLGFTRSIAVSGQTYTRKLDSRVLDTLSGIAQSAHKFAVDLRLLAHRREVEEPFEAEQIGSSAMAYKRNPMRSERICGLARFIMGLPAGAHHTEATQWFERTLDRRLLIPQAFLATDAVLRLFGNVAGGLVVHEKVIGRGVAEELPFMATEGLMMAAVKLGGDRQELHEVIRRHSHEVARRVKDEGLPNDLIARLQAEPGFKEVDFATLMNPAKFVGRAPEQVDEFLAEEVEPALAGRTAAALDTSLKV